MDAVVQNKTESSITIQWSPPDSDRPVPIKGYIVDRRKVGTKTWQRCNAGEAVETTEISISNFTEEATYQFRICAINAFGQSPYLEVPGSFYLGQTDHSATFLYLDAVALTYLNAVFLFAVCLLPLQNLSLKLNKGW